MKRMFLAISVVIGTLCGPAHECRGVDPGIVPPSSDTRFDAVFQLIKVYTDPAHPQYLDHLSNYNAVSGSGTLISPHLVLAAHHSMGSLVPGGSREPFARFRRKLDGTLPASCNPPSDYFHVKIVDWIQLNNTDMVIGLLETPVTHIDPIPMRYILPTDPRLADVTQRPDVYIAGWGQYDDGGCTRKLRYGRAVLALPEQYGASAFSVVNLSTTPIPGVPDPAAATTHDSGGPILLDDPVDGLQVIGTFHFPRSGPAVWGAFYTDPGDLSAASSLPADTSPTAGLDWPAWTYPSFPRYMSVLAGGGDRLIRAEPAETVWDPDCLGDLDDSGALEQSDRDGFVAWMTENVPGYVPWPNLNPYSVTCCDDRTCDFPSGCFGDVNGDGFANQYDEYIMNIAFYSDVIPRACFCYGDTNLDGSVDFFDLNTVISNHGAHNHGYSFIAVPGDANFDGATNFFDLNLVINQINSGCSW